MLKVIPAFKSHSKNFINVAFSGGVDSVVLLDFLIRVRHYHKSIGLAFFDHKTETSRKGLEFLNYIEDYYRQKYGYILPIKVGELSGEYTSNLEESWRQERYSFFKSLDSYIVTGHHLDDCVETYLFTMIRNGNPKVIPYQNGKVLRPLLLTEKVDIIKWAEKNGLKWVDDESNSDVKYSRNRIRHNIIPEVEMINPGFKTIVRKVVENNLRG